MLQKYSEIVRIMCSCIFWTIFSAVNLILLSQFYLFSYTYCKFMCIQVKQISSLHPGVSRFVILIEIFFTKPWTLSADEIKVELKCCCWMNIQNQHFYHLPILILVWIRIIFSFQSWMVCFAGTWMWFICLAWVVPWTNMTYHWNADISNCLWKYYCKK
jgi:hypothetical protein